MREGYNGSPFPLLALSGRSLRDFYGHHHPDYMIKAAETRVENGCVMHGCFCCVPRRLERNHRRNWSFSQ